jgi:uncharacterized protein (DUF1501 family)
MKRIFAFAAVGLALLLTGCGTSFPEKAYKVGQSYELSQQAAISYIEVAKPSAEVTHKIKNANDKAAPMVKQVLSCAKSLVDETPAPEATALGLDADDALEAQEEVCEDLLSRALLLLQALDTTVKES